MCTRINLLVHDLRRDIQLVPQRPAYDRVEHRDEQQAEERRGQHAADDARADRMPRIRAGAGGDRQRQHAHDEGERGHQDRAQSQLCGFDHGLSERLAFLALLDRDSTIRIAFFAARPITVIRPILK